MDNNQLKKEFEILETKIKEYKSNNQDVTDLLKTKVRLLQTGYCRMTEAMKDGSLEPIAANFARELAFLNNIKSIKDEINEDSIETENEIKKIYENMRENGLGWLLDNMPQKAEPTDK